MDTVSRSVSAPPVLLNYHLGEYKVATSRLAMQIRHGCLTEPPGEGMKQAAIPEGMDGVMYRSRPIAARLPRITISDGVIRYAPKQYQHFFIDLTLSEDDYLAQFSAKSRSTLKRKVRKFAKACADDETIQWHEYKTPEEIEKFYDTARAISRKTYQERLLDAGLPDNDAFYQAMLRLAAADNVRAYLLFMQDKPIAYLYCPIADGILSYDYLGYDPEYAGWSPGTVLQWLALQKLFAEKTHRLFDFTEGEGPHKAFFATGSQLCANIYYLRLRPVNLLRVYLHAGLDNVSESMVGTLERFGLKTKIKKALRTLARAPAAENSKGSVGK